MKHTAKLFMNGRSQAVRLPKEFRFNCKEVYIHKDEKTGNIVISKKPNSWDGLFELLDTVEIPVAFMQERDNETSQERDLF